MMTSWKARIAFPALALTLIVGVPRGTSGEEVGQHLKYRGEPVDLGHQGARVGELIEDVVVVDLGDTAARLSERIGERGLVVAVRDVECPLSRKYAPRLARLEKEYRQRGFSFLYVNPNPHDTPEDMRQEAGKYGFEAPYTADAEARLTRALAARVSTEVFVLDAARTLAGTVIRARAWYDNSARNPANPDPTIAVEFGEQTWDEMMIGYINWVPASAAR